MIDLEDQPTDSTYSFEVKEKKSIGFKLLCLVMLIFSLLNIYRGYQGFSPSSRLFEYHWYPYSTIFFGLVCLISVFLVYNFRKIGVYLMVLALFLDIVQQPQFGMMGTITSVFSLFVFIGYGLMVIIPRWAMFK